MYNCAVPNASADTLRKVPLFSGLDNKELEQIASSMRERRFKAGDTMTQEGSGGVGFFVVEEGEAEVSVGGQAKGSIGPGDYFGENADRAHGHALLRHDAMGLPSARRDQLGDRLEAPHGNGREDEVRAGGASRCV